MTPFLREKLFLFTGYLNLLLEQNEIRISIPVAQKTSTAHNYEFYNIATVPATL